MFGITIKLTLLAQKHINKTITATRRLEKRYKKKMATAKDEKTHRNRVLPFTEEIMCIKLKRK